MRMKKEGLNRLHAERKLVSLYRKEYESLARRRGHVDALRALVKTHKTRYDAIVREVRNG